MEVEGLSNAIYGDLGEFQFAEKLKEQNEEIASLTGRLNQSVVAITDLQKEIKCLKKENRQVNKNTSSLLLTAKLELGRKQRDIASLQQKIDNILFRRPNNYSIAVQTEPVVKIDPMFYRNVNNVNVLETGDHLQNNCKDLKKFRIHEKNPFAKHENKHELMNNIDPCKTKKDKNTYDQPRLHLPKMNSYAKFLDDYEEKFKVSCLGREEINGSKDRRDNRRHSPVMHTSSRQRDYVNFDTNSDVQNRHKRNDQKYLPDRSSNDEKGRHSKRYRSESTSNRHRSRSKPGTVEETCSKTPKTKSPKNSNLKPGKDNRIDYAVKSRNDCVSHLKEKDLKAMLIVQKKILEEMHSQDSQLFGLKQNSLKECRKQKNSNYDDAAKKLTNHEQSEDPDSANGAIANAVISESKNITEVATAETLVNQKNLNGLYVSRENIEVLSIVPNHSNQEPPSMEASINNLNLYSPLREFFAPAKQPLESTNSELEKYDTPKTNQFQNNENSGSQMDIDYELMKRTSGENQTNLSYEEKNRELLVESNCESLPTQINVSLMEKSFVKENNLNSSSERHILSKNSEYFVQDVGHEIRIFLTKKRKNNKISKVTS